MIITKKSTESLQYYLMSLKMYGWSRLISVNLTFCRLLMNIILILKFRKHCENSFGPFSFDFTLSLTSLLEKTLNCTDVIKRKSLHASCVVSTCFSGTRWTVPRNLDIVKKSYPLFKTRSWNDQYYDNYVHPNIKSKQGYSFKLFLRWKDYHQRLHPHTICKQNKDIFCWKPLSSWDKMTTIVCWDS